MAWVDTSEMSTPVGVSLSSETFEPDYAARLKSELRNALLEDKVEKLSKEVEALRARSPVDLAVEAAAVDADAWRQPLVSHATVEPLPLAPGARERQVLLSHLCGAVAAAG